MEAPKTPVQWFAVVAGIALAACGVLALAYGDLGFGTVGQGDGDELGIWRVSGWEAILYIGSGALGLMAAGRVATARAFSLLAGLAYAVMAVWGFVDGGSVASVFAVNTADNVTHAGIGALALIAGLAPVSAQRGDTVGAEARREHERHGQDPPHVFPA